MNKIIAIDGPTASGKGTLAKKIAEYLHLPYLNTGGLYRAIALYMIDNKLNYNKKEEVIKILNKVTFDNLENPNLYVEKVGSIAGKIATINEVRQFLLKFQRDFAYQDNGAVLDGRDIGTVICPDAKYKFYINASLEERAKRRFKEMKLKNENVDFNEIFTLLKDRDERDIKRANSPLKKAEDAIEIDTTNKNVEEVFEYILSIIKDIK